MEITDIRATTHNLAIELPLLDDPYDVPISVVRVETDAGVTGHGLTGYYWPYAVTEMINKEMKPVVLGSDPRATERVWDDLRGRLNLRDQTGVWSSAISAVDIALWDIKGKAFEEPVWRLLGGARRTVPAYITFGHPDYSTEQLVTVAESLVDDGEDKLKMVVGTGHEADSGEPADPKRDARRVRAVREAVGEDVQLMLDANYTLSIDEAMELSERVEPCDITWFEEPVYGNDAELLRALRRQTSIPIAAGQNEGHRFRHRELIASGAVDISQPNVVWGGGYSEGLKVANLASTYNLKIANGGGWPHHNMHLQAAVANGWRVEFHYLMWQVGERIYQDPPAVDGGQVTLTEEPGLGLTLDEEALAENLVD